MTEEYSCTHSKKHLKRGVCNALCVHFYLFISAILPDQQGILRMLEVNKQARKVLESRQHCFHVAQTGKHLLRTQNVSDQNQKHFLCPGHKICVRNKCCARGQTGKHSCRQQCVRKNVSSFASTYMSYVNKWCHVSHVQTYRLAHRSR